jgi:hypothetical protein
MANSKSGRLIDLNESFDGTLHDAGLLEKAIYACVLSELTMYVRLGGNCKIDR